MYFTFALSSDPKSFLVAPVVYALTLTMTKQGVVGVGESERRRAEPASPLEFLTLMPSLTLLGRLQIPMLAVHDNKILYANSACEAMLGYGRGQLVGCSCSAVFKDAPALGTPMHMITYLRDQSGTIIDLVHHDGLVVRAIVSESPFRRDSDPVSLVSLQNVTERLWNGDSTV